MIITTSHASLINGKIYEAPANTITEILKNRKRKFIFIRHSMDGKLPSTIYRYKNGKVISSKEIFILPKIAATRYVTEIVSILLYFLFKKHNENIYYIGVDPLNAFTGILLKKAGKFKKIIFYTVDYSPRRFKNKALNYIYHWIDRFCVKNADQVWNVSSRIRELRKKMEISESKNIFLPNIPSDEYKKFTNNNKQKYSIITLGIIDKQLDFIRMFEAIKELKDKYPKILLKIVGNGLKEDQYKQCIKDNNLGNNIKFLGHLSHNQALEEISKSSIGIALYNKNWNFNYYGDSMKCREYFCFGLPVITTDTHSTVEEIKEYRAGIVCNMNKNDYIKAIEKILVRYDFYSKNSYLLNKKYQDIHLKLLNNF